MRKNLIILFSLVVIIVGGYSYKVWSKNNRYKLVMKEFRYIDKNNDYSDILDKYELIFNNNSDSFVEPVEGTYSDFNTYYGNLIRKEIGNEINPLLIEILDEQISKDLFMIRKNGEVFEGLERLYFYDHLATELNLSLDYHLVKSQYVKHYREFHTEIKENIDKLQGVEDSNEMEYELSILWSQIYYATYLEQKYGAGNFTELIDWTMKLLDNDMFLSLTTYKFKIDTLVILNMNNEWGQPLDKNEVLEYITDLQDVYNYSEMVKNGHEEINFDNLYIDQLHENLLLADFSDLQEVYYQIKILKNLNEPISENTRKFLTRKFLIYQYDNETLPVITKIVPSIKQLMITNNLCNMLLNEKCIYVVNTNYEKFTEDNMDSMDLYAKYIFDYIFKKSIPEDDQLVEKFLNGRNYFDLSSITQLSHYLKTKSKINKNVNIEDISFDFVNYLDSLSLNSSNITVHDLILLDSLSDLSIQNIPFELVDKIFNLEFNPNEDLYSYKVTYLYKIIFKYETDSEIISDLKKDFKKFTDSLRMEGGYKQNQSDSFANMPLTYLILETFSSIQE